MLSSIQRLLVSASLAIIITTPGELPKGTKIDVRLTTRLASESSKAGEPVEAVVIVPVTLGEETLIPIGTKVRGKIKEVKSTEGKTDQRATLLLKFDELESSSGKKTKLAAKVTEVDNARETVDSSGNITGILASETLASRMDQGLGKLGQQHSGLADFLNTLKKMVVKDPQPEIDYPAGTDMVLELTENLKEKIETPTAGRVKTLSNPELGPLVNSQPFRTYSPQNPPKPSDITNLMFLGSKEQLESSFKDAGWSSAEALSSQSGLETFRAIVENRGYKEAPMSLLVLGGRNPEMVFQKQNNTFAKRHHLRIWRRPGTFEGRDVWVASSTHDVDIVFSPENRTFIHKIDSNIDHERSKVADDLIYAGRVEAYALVDRTGIPPDATNATGDKLVTDGRMAVLELK